MDLDFSIDFEAQEIRLVIDNKQVIQGWLEDGSLHLSNCSNLDEDFQEHLKQIMQTMFKIEEI
jgi:hypothetical protein